MVGISCRTMRESCEANEIGRRYFCITPSCTGAVPAKAGIRADFPEFAYMKEQKSGQIITMASVAAYKVFPASAVYSATKYAVRALTEGLRQEVKPYNIRTMTISPGAVKTELLEHISDKDVQSVNEDYVGRVGVSPDSYARIVAFAVSQPEDVDVNELVFRPTAQEM